MPRASDAPLIGAMMLLKQKVIRMLNVLDEPKARRHAARMVDASCSEVRELLTEELNDGNGQAQRVG